ncbi:unnamed protein product [Linum trigynum]|uniref:Uncharacterized protein n=1 Tax=Linum trigynum TaxID=586398 RepID=A0AAV2CGN1_9ROSI
MPFIAPKAKTPGIPLHLSLPLPTPTTSIHYRRFLKNFGDKIFPVAAVVDGELRIPFFSSSFFGSKTPGNEKTPFSYKGTHNRRSKEAKIGKGESVVVPSYFSPSLYCCFVFLRMQHYSSLPLRFVFSISQLSIPADSDVSPGNCCMLVVAEKTIGVADLVGNLVEPD